MCDRVCVGVKVDECPVIVRVVDGDEDVGDFVEVDLLEPAV